MTLLGFEPRSKEPESFILSIELQSQIYSFAKVRKIIMSEGIFLGDGIRGQGTGLGNRDLGAGI